VRGGEQEITTSLAKPSAIGILVQRLTRGRKVTIGRVPLGHHHGLVTIRWHQHVDGRKLAPGRYLITLRALNPESASLRPRDPSWSRSREARARATNDAGLALGLEELAGRA
jgi:hypothetical protein